MSCDYVLRIYYTLLPRTGACKLMRISPSDKYVYGLRSMDYGVWSPPYFVPASLFARTVVTGSSSFRLMKAYGVHGLHADNRVWSTYSVQNNAHGLDLLFNMHSTEEHLHVHSASHDAALVWKNASDNVSFLAYLPADNKYAARSGPYIVPRNR